LPSTVLITLAAASGTPRDRGKSSDHEAFGSGSGRLAPHAFDVWLCSAAQVSGPNPTSPPLRWRSGALYRHSDGLLAVSRCSVLVSRDRPGDRLCSRSSTSFTITPPDIRCTGLSRAAAAGALSSDWIVTAWTGDTDDMFTDTLTLCGNLLAHSA